MKVEAAQFPFSKVHKRGSSLPSPPRPLTSVRRRPMAAAVGQRRGGDGRAAKSNLKPVGEEGGEKVGPGGGGG